jgi:NADH-quinone oxidoreductase subunit G
LVNSEGRAQRFFQALDPGNEIQASWRWLRDGAEAAEIRDKAQWKNLDELTSAISEEIEIFKTLPQIAPQRNAIGKIAREPHRYSGRTAMLANVNVHEPKPPEDSDSALAFSMESGPVSPPPSLLPFFWAPGWNSIQAVNKFQTEVGGPLRGGDPGLRLIEPSPEAIWQYCTEIPSAFRPRPTEWLLVGIYHLFGSEELSRHAHGIAQLLSQPYLALNPIEASLLGIAAGDKVTVTVADSQFELEAVLRVDLPRGIAGLPLGLSPIVGISLPAFCRLSPSNAELSARRAS